MTAGSILVGLEDSPAAKAAHRWAASYAQASGAPLRVVHILEWPVGLRSPNSASGTRLQVEPGEIAESYRRGMNAVFSDVASPAGSMLQFAQGDVADILVQLSEQADLLVLGTRQAARAHLYLAGMINRHCITYAVCPVVTVPGPTTVRANDTNPVAGTLRATVPRTSLSDYRTAYNASRHGPNRSRMSGRFIGRSP